MCSYKKRKKKKEEEEEKKERKEKNKKAGSTYAILVELVPCWKCHWNGSFKLKSRQQGKLF